MQHATFHPQLDGMLRACVLHMVQMATARAAPAAADAAPQRQLQQELSHLSFPPHRPLAGSLVPSFAHTTITRRLPTIMDSVLQDLQRLVSTAAGARSRRLVVGG